MKREIGEKVIKSITKLTERERERELLNALQATRMCAPEYSLTCVAFVLRFCLCGFRMFPAHFNRCIYTFVHRFGLTVCNCCCCWCWCRYLCPCCVLASAIFSSLFRFLPTFFCFVDAFINISYSFSAITLRSCLTQIRSFVPTKPSRQIKRNLSTRPERRFISFVYYNDTHFQYRCSYSMYNAHTHTRASFC